MSSLGARFYFYTLLAISYTNPNIAYSIGLIKWCRLKLQAREILNEAGNDSTLEKGTSYNIVTDQGVFRGKFLGHENLIRGDKFFDELIFQDAKTHEIVRIQRRNIRGLLDDGHKSGAKYALNKHYKFMTSDSQVVNGIFLGEQKMGAEAGTKKISILNTDNGRVESFFEWEIFHSAFNKEAQKLADLEAARDKNAEPTFKIIVKPKKQEFELPITPIPHNQNPQFKAGVDPNILAKLTPHQLKHLKDFINLSFEYVTRYDRNMRRAFPMQRIDDSLAIHFRDNARSPYTYTDTVPIDGEETRFIRMSLDLSRDDLGLDVSVVLHERGHHYGTNNSISTKSEISLLNDSAYREGLADYFVAHEMKDPALGRNFFSNSFWIRNIERRQEYVDGELRTIKSPLDATNSGHLEPHALSIFYSYPLWRSFVRAKQTSPRVKAPELWQDFHAKMERAFNRYQENKAKRSANAKTEISDESAHLQNIEFFYSYLYYEAFLNPKTTAEKKTYLQEGYLEAKKAFILSWQQIEKNAVELNLGTQN